MNDPIREFSAKVSIDLIVGGETLPVRQSGGEFLVLSHPWPVPPTIGTLVLSIDHVVRRLKVYLTEGIQPGRDEHPIVILSGAEAAA